jgi:TetR/AcrR family transcriptional regulator, cholesterol catabolism regulator
MAPRKARADAPSESARSSKAGAGTLNGARARDREVIEAAVKIFWEKGYANASVQDVADALGMLKGSLYYYIDSKERLLEKIFDDSHAELSQIAEAASKGEGPAVDRMARFLFDYAMWTLTHLEQAGLYSREWRYASDQLKSSLGQQQRFYDRILRKLIVEGQEEGSLSPDVEPRAASLFIWSAFTGLPDWYRPASKADARKTAAMYVELARRAWGATSPWADSTGTLLVGSEA